MARLLIAVAPFKFANSGKRSYPQSSIPFTLVSHEGSEVHSVMKFRL